MELVLYVVVIAYLSQLPGMPSMFRPVSSEDRIFRFGEDYSQEGSGNEDSYYDILEPSKKPATIFESLEITSTVNWRYASTSTVATFTNTADQPQEVDFSVKLSRGSFISRFTMIVNDLVYEGKVKDGYVTEDESESEIQWNTPLYTQRDDLFSIQLRLAEGAKIVFNLTYQEILQRFNKVFRHAIHLSPSLIAEDMRLEVFIDEPEGLTSVDALWVCATESNQRDIEISLQPGSKEAYVVFTPSSEEVSQQGSRGNLEVTYAVAAQKGGVIQVHNGYFVHFFSFDGLGLVPKQVMFVIDISGSMTGRNLQYTKLAVSYMLQQLHAFDYFNILTFSNNVYKWRPSFVPAKPKYIDAGIRFLKKLNAHGGTSMKEALLFATKAFSNDVDGYLSIIFVTDGVPTVGGTKSSRITRTVTEAIAGRIALFCIGIGDKVDDAMLRQLAGSNHGRYRNVEIGLKATNQMKTFYDEISNPLLFDVRINYDSNTINNDSLPLTHFPGYLEGQEIVVPGMLRENLKRKYLNVTVEGNTGKERFDYFRSKSIGDKLGLEQLYPVPLDITSVKMTTNSLRTGYHIDSSLAFVFKVPTSTSSKHGNIFERFWALSKIKDLNRQRRTARSSLDRMSSTHEMMQISQKYGFVTPITPIVVLNQNRTGVNVEEPQPFEFLGLQQPFSKAEEASLRTFPNLPASYRRATQGSEEENTAPILKVFGDPHFAIDIPGSNSTICFDVQKKQGTVLRLLSDPYPGLMVNAEVQEDTTNILTSAVSSNSQGPSMFARFGISLGVHRILVLNDEIIIDGEISFQWKIPHSISLEEYNLTISDRENLTITNIDGLRMRIQRHVRIKHPTYFDFILEDGRCLTPLAHGLIGQFQHKYFRLKEKKIHTAHAGQMTSVMVYKEREFLVHKRKIQSKGSSDCWHGPAEQFIDGSIDEYVVEGIFN